MSHRFSLLVLTLAAVACADRSRVSRDSTQRVVLGETALAPQVATLDTVQAPDSEAAASSPPHARTSHLSPEAQAIADALVFVPRTRNWFALSVRARRLVVDLGRADLAVPRDTADIAPFRAALREAATRLSPLRPGEVLLVRGPWGVQRATLADFDIASGRIVGTLELQPRLASLVRRNNILPGAATRWVDTTVVAAADSATASRDGTGRPDSLARHDSVVRREAAALVPCMRDSIDSTLVARVAFVRDSLERWLTDSARSPFPRLDTRAKVKSWSAVGCFQVGRVLVFAARHDPSAEFAIERALVLDDSGRVMRLRVADLRFRVHEPLAVFDADGDGIDDVAARALGERSGGITILRFDTTARRLERLTSGFSWETR